ncbi:MAG: helix-turn-helix transcriptional regulator [bacterium]|nr:helix-turn-helix transcriptional regulator [bacterium]MCM1374999.1 helix-turn-helix transcriptional regulator [Muribaculum sp.]
MRIEELCSKGGITRYQLSSRTGISQSALSDIVRKKNVPSLITIERICAAFGITIAQFFTQGEHLPDLSDEQKELLLLWNGLKLEEKEIVTIFIKSIRK